MILIKIKREMKSKFNIRLYIRLKFVLGNIGLKLHKFCLNISVLKIHLKMSLKYNLVLKTCVLKERSP